MARCLNRVALLLLLLTLSGVSFATDWELSLDTRLVSSDAYPSFMDGGLGTVRFGSDDSGVRLGRARFAVTQPIGELWSAHLDASAYDDAGRSPVGLTEAYLLFRPYPFAGWRFRLKAGGFYAPLSLENRAAGWDSPYTISYSAIDSWLGVEVHAPQLPERLCQREAQPPELQAVLVAPVARRAEATLRERRQRIGAHQARIQAQVPVGGVRRRAGGERQKRNGCEGPPHR